MFGRKPKDSKEHKHKSSHKKSSKKEPSKKESSHKKSSHQESNHPSESSYQNELSYHGIHHGNLPESYHEEGGNIQDPRVAALNDSLAIYLDDWEDRPEDVIMTQADLAAARARLAQAQAAVAASRATRPQSPTRQYMLNGVGMDPLIGSTESLPEEYTAYRVEDREFKGPLHNGSFQPASSHDANVYAYESDEDDDYDEYPHGNNGYASSGSGGVVHGPSSNSRPPRSPPPSSSSKHSSRKSDSRKEVLGKHDREKKDKGKKDKDKKERSKDKKGKSKDKEDKKDKEKKSSHQSTGRRYLYI